MRTSNDKYGEHVDPTLASDGQHRAQCKTCPEATGLTPPRRHPPNLGPRGLRRSRALRNLATAHPARVEVREDTSM